MSFSATKQSAETVAADRVPLPKDAWYIAAATTTLGVTPLATQIFDFPLVLFREENGDPVALHDRCPHRGTPLSLGQITKSNIACAYHGWQFSNAGACTHIPSLLEGRAVPKGIGVRKFPCMEQDGYIWVWTGDAAPDSEPLEITDFKDRVWVQGQLELACEAVLPIENNLDICHPNFTHPNLHPQYFAVQKQGFRKHEYDVVITETGLLVTGTDRSVNTVLRFDLPDRVTVRGPGGFMIVLHHVPMGVGRCKQHWLMSIGLATRQNPHAVHWSVEMAQVLEQDRRILEAAQLRYASDGEAFEHSVEADVPTITARRILRMAGAGRWKEDRQRLNPKRTIALRG